MPKKINLHINYGGKPVDADQIKIAGKKGVKVDDADASKKSVKTDDSEEEPKAKDAAAKKAPTKKDAAPPAEDDTEDGSVEQPPVDDEAPPAPAAAPKEKAAKKEVGGKKEPKKTSFGVSPDGRKFIDLEPNIAYNTKVAIREWLKNKKKLIGANDMKEGLDHDEELVDVVIEELEEAGEITVAMRRHRAMTMRRFASKLKMGRERAKRKKAPDEKLKMRARRKARMAMRKKFAANKAYGDMSDAEKISVDKRLSKIPSSILDRIAQRVLPSVRRAELQRMADLNKPKHESVNEAFRAIFLEQAQSINLDELTADDFADLVESFISEAAKKPADREEGTDSLVKAYKGDTPGECDCKHEDLAVPGSWPQAREGDRVSFELQSVFSDNDVANGSIHSGIVVGSSITRLRVRDDDGKLWMVKYSSLID